MTVVGTYFIYFYIPCSAVRFSAFLRVAALHEIFHRDGTCVARFLYKLQKEILICGINPEIV